MDAIRFLGLGIRLTAVWALVYFAFASSRLVAGDGKISVNREQATPVTGTLVICGGGSLPAEVLDRFVELAGGTEAHIVVITTASETAESAEVETRLEFWRRKKLAALTILHTRSRENANNPTFTKPLANATGVWFIGGSQAWVTDTYLGTATEQLIHGVLKRGGVIGGTSAGAAIMSPIMIRQGNPEAEVGKGFGFLPGTVVDQHFLVRNRQDRLMNVLSAYPGLVGFGIDEGTALIVHGRRLQVLGESQVVACLAPSVDRPARLEMMKAGTEADLVALSRAAIARTEPNLDSAAPVLAKGTLVVVGGGTVPPEATRRFIDAAGGPESPIVVVSTAMGDEIPGETEVCGWLRDAGAKNVRQIHARNRREAEHPDVLSVLRTAKGVWFSGGRQWRLIDAYQDTAAEKLFHNVLERGGVIGGTSAGAAVQAGYLVRGNPLGNSDIMSEGYERGFSFLPGVAIDPHFSQRKRHAEMQVLKQVHPQLLGLGVDDSTALIVQGQMLEVVGRHQVAVFDRTEPVEENEKVYQVLRAGDRYDLKELRRISTTEVEAEVPQEQVPVVGALPIPEAETELICQ